MRAMASHAALFGNRFGMAELERAVVQGDERVYGFDRYAANRDRVRGLAHDLRIGEREWLPEASRQVSRLFPAARLDDIVICR